MTSDGQLLTKKSYEDPTLVEKYAKKKATETNHIHLIKKFSSYISGHKVLDLGCGPGHHSAVFSQLGFEVTGLDYSKQMIAQAKKDQGNQIANFIVGDMLRLPELFKPQSFDAVWAAASLLHIPESRIDKILEDIATISTPNACVFISLKSGNGTHIIVEDQYLSGIIVQREYTLWEKEAFLHHTSLYGYSLIEYHERKGRMIQGLQSKWNQFTFRINT